MRTQPTQFNFSFNAKKFGAISKYETNKLDVISVSRNANDFFKERCVSSN